MDMLALALKKLNAVVLDTPETRAANASPALVLTLNANLMTLGYSLSERLLTTLNQIPSPEVAKLGEAMMSVLKKLKGSHVKHQPMYPNFPKQVMDASLGELYWNAILHYFSLGTWQPNYQALPREFAFETTKFQIIEQISQAQFRDLFTTLLQSADSLSADDKAIVEWFLAQEYAGELKFPETIPFHETQCLVAGTLLNQGHDITPLIKNTTDVLRIVTHLSGGDISLATNTKFRSLTRPLRKTLVKYLERVISEEDIGRHRNKWVRLFHNLHVGEYSKKVFKIADKARNGQKLTSFYGDLEALLQAREVEQAVSLLRSRPGEFGRRLDHVLRIAQDHDYEMHAENYRIYKLPASEMRHYKQEHVIKGFLNVVAEIPTRNLTQLLGHLNSRSSMVEERVVFPKGNLQKAVVVKQPLDALNTDLVQQLTTGIQNALIKRFATLAPLGKVWVDPALQECYLPTQQRSASSGLFSVARGTRLPIESDKDTIRLFVYWVGMDIDLSATFHDETGKLLDWVSYTQLRSNELETYHSGDITRALKGASEFIDIKISAAAKKARYVGMQVNVFNGPTFGEHKECFVGWMMRDKPNHNAIYEPATVKQKLDLTQNCRTMMPVVFDLVERKIIWTDLPNAMDSYYRGNNVENNRASIEQKLYAILNIRNRLSLYELFLLHAQARGEVVADKTEADTIFSLEEGITPFQVNEINANFIV